MTRRALLSRSALPLAALVLAFAHAPRGNADCALPRVSLALLTPPAARVPITSGPGSGLVAAITSSFAPVRGDPTPQLVGATTIALRQVQVAPGLVRLEPASAPPPGRYRVEGLGPAQAPVEVELAALPMPPLLAAPAPRSAALRSLDFDRHAGERFVVSLDLGAPVPPGAVAIAARWGASGDRSGIATTGGTGSSGRVAPGARVVTPFETPSGCGLVPEGMVPPRAGAPASFAFVDALGRTGAWSPAIRVARD